jgi:hypothetical protein
MVGRAFFAKAAAYSPPAFRTPRCRREAAQAVGAVDARGAFARREESGDVRHLAVAVHPDAAHDVVGGGAHFHGHRGDVDVGELLELVVHRGQFPLDVLGRVGKMLLDPADVEEHAAVR